MKKLILLFIFLAQLNAKDVGIVIDNYFDAVENRNLPQIKALLYRPSNKRLIQYKAVFGGVEQEIKDFSIVKKDFFNNKAIVKVNLQAKIKDKFSNRSFNEDVNLIFLLQKDGNNWKIAKVMSDADFDIAKRALFLQRIKSSLNSNNAGNNITSQNGNYIGCYKDSGDPFGTENRDLNGFMLSKSDMTVKKCINLCKSKGFKYAGLEYSSYCFCGNSYGKYGKTNNCNMKCSGNAKEICGGFWANSIYSVNGKDVVKPNTPNNLDNTKKDIIYNSGDSGENFLKNNAGNEIKDMSEEEAFKPQKGNLIDLEDGFKLGLDSSIWEVYEWKTLRRLNGNNLVHNDYLDLQCNKTDQSAFVATKPIFFKKGEILHIKMRIKVHYANRYFEGGIWFYGCDVGKKITMPKNKNAWLNVFGKNLFNVTHYHYYYEKPGVTPYVPTHNGFAIYSMNWRKDNNYGIINPIWDKWFIEDIYYNPAKKEAILKIGNQIKKIHTPEYNKYYIRFIIHPYGWYTGHSLQIDWIRITAKKGDKILYK